MKEDISKASPERHKKRIQLALPIRVTYWDNTQKPCLEIACTYDISEHGARVTGLRCVKEAGEVIAIERGRNKAFCRVVWVGEPNSELAGQIGLQSVESDRMLWEAELKDMVEVYEPITLDGSAKGPRTFASHERRRRRERFNLEGSAELVEQGDHIFKADVILKNMSEMGCLVLTKHMQLQVILKPPPENVQELYLESLGAMGIDLRQHDIKFEEDNWESPTLGAWGIGWQVMLDGLEITQFTYFQQCGGVDLDPISAELTYGLERIASFLQDKDSIYDIVWARDPENARVTTYGDVRLADELQFSVYNFELADVEKAWKHFELCEGECKALLEKYAPFVKEKNDGVGREKQRFPLLAAYDLCLKCSHLFNILDARGAISVTERVGVIARVRALAVGIAKAFVDQQRADPSVTIRGEAIAGKKQSSKKERLSSVGS